MGGRGRFGTVLEGPGGRLAAGTAFGVPYLMLPVLEAVPNFSEGRDLDLVSELVGVIAREGVDVLDWSADPDHHRSVVTFVGDPATVESASLAAARFALEHIDLRHHEGVHPRIGALDVLPFVPLHGLELEDAARTAHRVGRKLTELGLPIFFYGAASSRTRRLADIRRGGFEGLRDGFLPGREPDLTPEACAGPHPSAGATCVGARPVLLAWNVFVEGVGLQDLRAIASSLRESGGGFVALRVLALELPRSGRLQISMNLEDLTGTSPIDVFSVLEAKVTDVGGYLAGTEVVGMIPDPLVLPSAADRLRLLDSRPSRLLSARLADHLSSRAAESVRQLLAVIESIEEEVPNAVREAAHKVAAATGTALTPGYES